MTLVTTIKYLHHALQIHFLAVISPIDHLTDYRMISQDENQDTTYRYYDLPGRYLSKFSDSPFFAKMLSSI